MPNYAVTSSYLACLAMNHHMYLQHHEIERADLARPAEKANASGLPGTDAIIERVDQYYPRHESILVTAKYHRAS